MFLGDRTVARLGLVTNGESSSRLGVRAPIREPSHTNTPNECVCSAFLISEDWTVTKTLESPRRWASLTLGADHIGVSSKTMRRMIASGQITGYRIGSRLVRVDLNELDELLGGDRVA